jgi:hypothetical protein
MKITYCHMNWEMENSVGRLMQKKEGDGQLGYNKQKI